MAEKIIDHSEFYFQERLPFLRKRCPDLSEEELQAAEELFFYYIGVTLETIEQLEKEGVPLNTRKEIREYMERLEIERQRGLDMSRKVRRPLRG